MAANAYAFATAPWHYDPQDHRCLHDSWVDELAIYEGDDTGSGARGADILVRLLGPHHDDTTVSLKMAVLYRRRIAYSSIEPQYIRLHSDPLSNERPDQTALGIRKQDNSADF